MPDLFETIHARISARNYDSSFRLSPAEIEELVRYAQEAPSSFNEQNWRVVAFASEERKNALKAACLGQPMVTDAAVAFVFLGQKDGYRHVAETFEPMVQKQLAGPEIRDGWQELAYTLYDGKPDVQRDEAVRSCAFAAMTLMLAARGKGLDSCAMMGLDIDAVCALAGAQENETLGMVLVVGKAGENNWPRKPRKPLAAQLTIV